MPITRRQLLLRSSALPLASLGLAGCATVDKPSVQARLLDLLRGLVREMGLSAVIVTHDLAVVRLLAHRLMVMKSGHVVEAGLTDQVLDDPQHGYTQLLVSSVLQA